MSFTCRLLSRGAGVGQQRHLATVLDRHGDIALVLAAVAGHSPRADLAAVGDVLAEQGRVFVVDEVDLVLAENADLALRLAKRWLRHGKSAPTQGKFVRKLERRLVGEATTGGGRARPRGTGRRPAARAPH